MSKSPYKKKLIEVALPLIAINTESAREKSIRHGHPSTLHLWWARRPLAACRAILFASLVDDPGNTLPEKQAKKERERLFKIIEKLILWENTSNEQILKLAQDEIKKSVGDDMPSILDPFCGGGSIPLEAQRLGLPVYASDLNPVAVLITKSMIEIPPKFSGKPPVNPNSYSKNLKTQNKKAEGLADDVEYYGNWISEEAEKRIGHYYPKMNSHKVIAWIWARMVKCPNPACGAEFPLARSFELSKEKAKQHVWVEPIIDQKKKTIQFTVKSGSGKIPAGTVNKKGATCLVCNVPVPFSHVRSEGKAQRLSKRLMAIIADGGIRRTFLPPTDEQEKIANEAKPLWTPETELPEHALGFRVQLYGMTKHKHLFTQRQLLALTTFSDLVLEAHKKIHNDALKVGFQDDNIMLEEGGTGARAYADAVSTYLAFAVDRGANYWSTLTPWGGSHIVGTFGRQTLQMVWDFAEANPFGDRTGNWLGAIEWISLCLKKSIPAKGVGKAMQLDATKSLVPGITPMICFDPPYYDNIGYSDLSDYFYTWLRHSLGKIYPNLFSTMLTPKSSELIASPFRFDGDKKKAEEHFLNGLSDAFKLIKKNSRPDFPVTIFYAFKQEERDSDESGESTFVSTGWETMLEALISAGFQIDGTWPMRTERDIGWKGIVNSLASSIVLVCRHRPEDASLSTRREFHSLLRNELPSAISALQHGSVAPVDLAQSSIGPGIAVFSRYSKVLEADGTEMRVRTALQMINQELDSFLNARESELDQETRFCISWFEQYGMNEGPFGEADILAKAKNSSLQSLTRMGLIKSGSGKVKLLSRKEYSEELNLSEMEKISLWACTQEMIKKLETEGEEGVAKLIKKLGAGQSEAAKDLSYMLYSISNRKKWADEALAYNSLVSSWSMIQEKSGLVQVPLGQTRL